MSLRQHPVVQTLLAALFLLAAPISGASADNSGQAAQKAAPAASADGKTSAEQAQVQSVPAKMPRLVVVGLALDTPSEKVAEALVRQANLSAKNASRFEVVSARDVLDADGAKAKAAALTKASALIAAAHEDYDNLELEDAKNKAQEAIGLLQNTDLSDNFSLYVEARKVLIAALLADSENKAADDILNKMLPQDLTSAFDPNLFSPDYIAQVNSQRTDLQKNASGSLDLTTAPVAAQVYVDGVFKGISPVEIRGMPQGEHVLTMVAPGYQVLQKHFTTGAADTRTEKLTPVKKGFIYTPFLKALKGKFLSEDRAQPAKEMAKFLGADQLTIVAVRNQGAHTYSVTLVRMDASDGHEFTNTEFALNDSPATLDSGALKTLSPLFAVDLPRGASGQAVKAKVNPFRWRERHTAFVLYGVTAAALGSGIVFGLDAHNQAATYKDLTAPQNSPVYDRVEKVGKRSALIADISYGVAIAAAVTGTILLVHDLLKDSAPSALVSEGEIDGGEHRAPVADKKQAADTSDKKSASAKKAEVKKEKKETKPEPSKPKPAPKKSYSDDDDGWGGW